MSIHNSASPAFPGNDPFVPLHSVLCPVPDWFDNPFRAFTDEENKAISDWYVALGRRKPDAERLGPPDRIMDEPRLAEMKKAGKTIFPTQHDFDDYIAVLEEMRDSGRRMAQGGEK